MSTRVKLLTPRPGQPLAAASDVWFPRWAWCSATERLQGGARNNEKHILPSMPSGAPARRGLRVAGAAPVVGAGPARRRPPASSWTSQALPAAGRLAAGSRRRPTATLSSPTPAMTAAGSRTPVRSTCTMAQPAPRSACSPAARRTTTWAARES